ncbi:hypothetical protein DUD43_08985 [Alcaligenes faecalis]|nr:hypothetical protein DUD43_08985 [Alcaligenes faecalis]
MGTEAEIKAERIKRDQSIEERDRIINGRTNSELTSHDRAVLAVMEKKIASENDAYKKALEGPSD